MVQFQSTLSFLKTPPQGYNNDAVDLIGGLDDIGNKVKNGDYKNEYDFENDIAGLMTKAHDGHLNFDGMAYGGVFRWRRSRQITLASGSSDGSEMPKLWAIQDFNQTGGSFQLSAVSKIDGKDATQFVQEESLLNAYHDPDTRYNAMFYMQPAESFGLFTNPRFYPGPSTNLTFENGTTQTYTNLAVILDPAAWSYVEDGETFYETFITPSSSNSKRLTKRENPNRLPRQLQHLKEPELSHLGTVPPDYPDPVVEHSAPDVPLAGYFIDTSAGTIGVLMVQTFNPESNSDAREFQSVIQDYISEAKSRNVAKHVIDVRANGGGKILLGYDMYLQFFPSQEPQLMSRYRGHQATQIIGEQVSGLKRVSELYTSPFNYRSYLNKDLQAFGSWNDLYGPTTFNGDNFTNLLRYNLSDPLTTTDEEFSIGITVTGYGDRDNFTQDPFSKDDIVILTDGICASTCSLFTELMVQQSGVKTLAIGGRPELGPMQAVGGTKGSMVLQAQYLAAISQYMLQEFASSSEAREWSQFLLQNFSIGVSDATVNFQDNIRKGLEGDGIPTQFLNDTASCRVWYSPNDYLNVSAVWTKAAEVAFGKNGGLDEGRCVAGSVTSQQAQQGQGEGSPTNPESSPSPSKSKGAAAGLAPAQGGWTAIYVCGLAVFGSMVFGASLI